MLTAKEIAQQFGVKDHNVFYVLNTRKIYPDKRVGSTRLYGNEKVKKSAMNSGIKDLGRNFRVLYIKKIHKCDMTGKIPPWSIPCCPQNC